MLKLLKKSDTALSNGRELINKLKEVLSLCAKNKGLEYNETTFNVTKNYFRVLLMF